MTEIDLEMRRNKFMKTIITKLRVQLNYLFDQKYLKKLNDNKN